MKRQRRSDGATERLRRMVAALLGVLVALVLASPVSAASVRLRAAAVVGPSGPVTLGDVASIRGDGGEALAGVVLVEEALDAAGDKGFLELDLDAVRTALRDAGFGLGRLAMSGDRCMVRLRKEIVRPEPVAEAPRAEPEALDLSGPATVRTRVGELLVRMFDVDAPDLRVRFDERDKELLDQAEWGRRIVVRPTTTDGGPRMLIDVRVLSGEQTVASGVVRADVEIRRRVLVLAQGVERDQTLRAGMLSEVEMWLEPGGAAPIASLDEAVDMRTRRRLNSGSVLRAGDLEQPIAVRRGEVVEVQALNGGVALRTSARALGDGKVGERIECRIDRTRNTFMARVDAPGRVVVVLDELAAGAPDAE